MQQPTSMGYVVGQSHNPSQPHATGETGEQLLSSGLEPRQRDDANSTTSTQMVVEVECASSGDVLSPIGNDAPIGFTFPQLDCPSSEVTSSSSDMMHLLGSHLQPTAYTPTSEQSPIPSGLQSIYALAAHSPSPEESPKSLEKRNPPKQKLDYRRHHKRTSSLMSSSRGQPSLVNLLPPAATSQPTRGSPVEETKESGNLVDGTSLSAEERDRQLLMEHLEKTRHCADFDI